MKRSLTGSLLLLFLCVSPFVLAEPQKGRESLDGEGIMKKSLLAFYYQGRDMKARVVMRLVAGTNGESGRGEERVRELTMLRRNLDSGSTQAEQWYLLYFHSPGDVRGTSFLVHKLPNRDDDRWLFLPALRLTQRVAAQDRRSSFVGSDFTYEDVSGRDVEADRHTLLREEELQGRPCYVVESIPREYADYARKLSWVDRERFLPLREEYLDEQGRLSRLFAADEVKEIQGYWTILRRTMSDLKGKHYTEVTLKEISYNQNIPQSLFSQRSLQSPPSSWIR